MVFLIYLVAVINCARQIHFTLHVDPKEFDLSKYTNNSWKGCVIEVDLEYPKELHKLNNVSPLATDKIEIKREILSEY